MATRFYVNAPYAGGAALFSGSNYANTAKKNILKTGYLLDFGVSTSLTFTMLTLVSPPLATQTISGTFQGFFLARRTGLSGTMNTLATVSVINPDGTTRGTLLSSVGTGSPAYSASSTLTSKDWPVSTAVSSVNAQAGDYLRMDLILSFVGSASQSVGLYIKDGTAEGDITMSGVTGLGPSINPWVEFSQTLTFLSYTGSALRQHGNVSISASEAEILNIQAGGSYASEAIPDITSLFFSNSPEIETAPAKSVDDLSKYRFENYVRGERGKSLDADPNISSLASYDIPSRDKSLEAGPTFSPFDSYNIPTRDKSLEADMAVPYLLEKELQLSSSAASIGGSVVYTNRAHDSVASKLVRWYTTTPDTAGVYYPGPGVFGVTAVDYVVEGGRVL